MGEKTKMNLNLIGQPIRLLSSSETQGQIVGPKTKIKTGGKKFNEQKYEKKMRVLSYFCSSNFFPPVLIFVFGPTICPWVSEDGLLSDRSDQFDFKRFGKHIFR